MYMLLSSLVITTRDTMLSEGGPRLNFLKQGIMVLTGFNFALMQETLLSLLNECEINALESLAIWQAAVPLVQTKTVDSSVSSA